MSDAGQVIGTVVGAVIGFVIGGPTGAIKGAALGYKLTGSNESGSPTYSFGSTYNTKSHELPIPVVYGRNRIAGNTIYEKITDDNKDHLAIQVGVSEGPIQSINSIKVNKNGIKARVKLGERTQSADSINDQGQSFPYLAYISTSLNANEDISGSPVITSIVEGRKIETWNGSSWVTQYSNNPAYCLLDFLTNKRYGLGISKNYIDLDSFIEVGEYCDELVDGEHRFELDYILDAKKSSLDYIKEILATFRSYLLYSNGELRLKVDGPEAPVQSFTMDNIIAGSFFYSKTSKKERYNQVTVQYIDPDEHWEKIGAQYTLDSDIKKNGINELTIPLLGINRFSQAGRMARYFQKKSWYCPTFCSFKAGIDSLHCEVGDVITITHNSPGWVNKKFRILEIFEEENDEMKISCQEYNIAVYSDDGVVQQVKRDTTLPNPFEPPASVKNLSLIENNKILGDGTWIPGIKVTWNRPDYIVWQAGNIYISDDNGATWKFVQKVEGEQYAISNIAPEAYKVKVQSESKKRRREDFGLAATGQITIKGKDAKPSKVNWGLCDFTDKIILRWQPVNDLDLQGYEIRNDLNWGNSNGLVYRGLGLEHIINNLTQRQYTFYIKALDRSGNYSEEYSKITVTNPAPPAPQTPKITEFFESLWIEPYPVADNDLKGYKLYITESDGQGNPAQGAETEVVPLSTLQKVTYQADSGKSFLIECSAYDSLGEGSKSASIEATTKNITIPDDVIEQSQLIKDLKKTTEQNGLTINELSDEYTVKLNDNGVITGFGLATEGQTSEFAVLADKFRIFGTQETGSIPIFAVDTKDKKVYILGDLIAEKTIKAKIANIKEAIIDNANIINVEANKITTKEAKIQAAQIDSIQTHQIKVGDKPAPIVNPKPKSAHLWHFDRSLISTDGIKPIGTPVATLRPNAGKFGGAVAVEEGTKNLFIDPDFTEANNWRSTHSSNIVNISNTGGVDGGSYGYSTETWGFYQKVTGLIQGEKYTIFGYVRTPLNNIKVRIDVNGEKNLYINTNGKWTYFSYTFVCTNSEFYIYILDASKNNNEVQADKFQLEQKPFPTSFVDGTRSVGNLPYNHNLDMNGNWFMAGYISPCENVDYLTQISLDKWGYRYGYTAIMDFAPSAGGRTDMWWDQDNKTLNLLIGEDVGGSWVRAGNRTAKKEDKVFFAIVNEDYKTTLYVGLDGILDNDTITRTGDIKSSVIRLNGYNNHYLSSNLFDEFIWGQIAPSPEQIQSWYNADSPFYDAESVIAAGKGTTITANGVKTEATNGDYSILDWGNLKFFKNGYDIPYWYAKRVAYGTAQDGDYIDLASETGTSWDKPPKVITAIKSLTSYHNNYNKYKQKYLSFPSSITKDGFRVFGYSVVQGTPIEFDTNYYKLNNGQTVVSLASNRNTVTRIACRVEVIAGTNTTYSNNYSFTAQLYYKRTNSNTWIHHSTMRDSGVSNGEIASYTYNHDIPNLPAGQGYQFKLKFSSYGEYRPTYARFYNFISYGETVIDNGEVMWIAIEGGRD